MEDLNIIELYFARDEQAIKETDAKYGRLCHSIAYNILHNKEDSEECVNDTYIGNKEVGKWLDENVFAPGMLYPWNEMIERATGEKLTAKYYREQFQ